jgi:hypothetical protein
MEKCQIYYNAWRAGRKLGGSLIAFKFPKLLERPDSGPNTVLRENTDSGVISVNPDANSSTVTSQNVLFNLYLTTTKIKYKESIFFMLTPCQIHGQI